jgi:hypothetical protein
MKHEDYLTKKIDFLNKLKILLDEHESTFVSDWGFDIWIDGRTMEEFQGREIISSDYLQRRIAKLNTERSMFIFNEGIDK